KNPIYSTDLLKATDGGGSGTGGGAGGGSSGAGGSVPPSAAPEPTMRDLRTHIASDLDMANAVDLLELLVCGNIVGPDIPLRVVQQEVWRRHILETTAEDYTSDCEAEALPAMTVTYRLAGVDGEATEEVIDSLEDIAHRGDQDPEQKFGITRTIAEEGGLPLLLHLAQPPPPGFARAARRTSSAVASGGAASYHSSTSPGAPGALGSGVARNAGSSGPVAWQIFALSVRLLRRACMVAANRVDLQALK
ncbi:unnamed protein product, partial [Discosporangium mesarthrocarpum]